MLRRLFLLFCCAFLLPSPGGAVALRLVIEIDDAALRPVLEATLALPSGLADEERINRRWLKRYQRQLPTLVNDVLEPYGYFDSRTTSRVFQDETGPPHLQVSVDPGEPLRVTHLELDLTGPGSNQPELRQRLEHFPLQVGDVLRQDVYEQGKANLRQFAADLGFLQAAFQQHRLEVHLGERRAAIVLVLDTGIRYRFGETRFRDHDIYPERFLRRYLAYRPGDDFAYTLLGETQQNLFDADLFHDITVRALTDQAVDDRIPVEVALQPAPRHRLRPGVGYGTDTGGRVSLRYRNLNLLHRGHELHGDLLLAEWQQSLLSTYIIPDMDRLDSQTQLRIGFDREKTDSYTREELFAEAAYQRAFGNNLLGSLFVRLTREETEIGDDRTHSKMLLPGVRLAWRQVDASLNPQRGLNANLTLQGAREGLFADTSLVQLFGQVNLLHPLPNRFSLLLRLRGGTTWHEDPLRQVPASLRFFAGGDRSVRGYRYQSLGPKDADGQVIGGKHLLVASIELEKRLRENWGLALFYDIGNAFDNLADYELEQGAGLGIRRYTPIGPLRLDLARQLGTDRDNYRLHVSMGFGW